MELTPHQLDRAVGAVLGSAAGDAVGAPYEFGPPRPADAEAEPVGGGPFGWGPGEWTDDTQQAAAVVLAGDGRQYSEQAVAEALMTWFAAKPVDVASLVEAGILRRPKDGLRLLGEGELKAKLSLTVNHASAAARAAVEKAGGSISLIEKKILEADEVKRKKTAAKKAKVVKKKGGDAD